ncbi:MAG: quinone-dependent dihydroorotate dehydrogenase [Planctomycetota bacterium]|nr:MAG: quinone-dependent dihydroorotate dehydrogenase [Planctomycetota bacterium]
MLYRTLLRPLLFRLDAETAHHLTMGMLQVLRTLPGGMALARLLCAGSSVGLERTVFGLRFQNPVGLAAGLDKDAVINEGWESFGFGFVEIGTITPRPQPGNDRPRLFRLIRDRAIINRMGFNSGGVEAAVARLKNVPTHRRIVLAANIGKNKTTPNADAEQDYLACLRPLFPYVDYFVVNVSSPNTPNLRELQDREPLTRLLLTLQDYNHSQPLPKPILLKIAPDLSSSQLDDILAIAQEAQLAGLVATNTTIDRSGLATPESEVNRLGAGGLSGAPLTSRSTEVVRYLIENRQRQLPIVAVGGVMTPADALAKLDAGASLVQVYSGFIYEGPALVRGILQSLRERS